MARWDGWDRELGAKSHAGAFPFLPLNLLDKPVPKAILVQPLYRHEAESFAWCLIYICLSTRKDDGQIRTVYPQHLSSWFADSLVPKISLRRGLLDKIPYHQRTGPMGNRLYSYWITRYYNQQATSTPRPAPTTSDTLPTKLRVWIEKVAALKKEREALYEEPSSRESFRQVFQELLRATSVVPESKRAILLEVLTLVTDTYNYSLFDDPVP